MHAKYRGLKRELLVEAHRRLPAGQRLVQEAFTREHRRPVMVKFMDLRTDTFYFFDDVMATALSDAVIKYATDHHGGELTVTYSSFGEFRSQQHRLQHIAQKMEGIRVLAVGKLKKPASLASRMEFCDIEANCLARYRIALYEGTQPVLFICRQPQASKSFGNLRHLGFFTFVPDTIEEIAEDIDLALQGVGKQLTSFNRLRQLHETTQRVNRELESYSRRMELAIRRAQRHPELLTPARFNRIVSQAVLKMDQLRNMSQRALRSLDKPHR